MAGIDQAASEVGRNHPALANEVARISTITASANTDSPLNEDQGRITIPIEIVHLIAWQLLSLGGVSVLLPLSCACKSLRFASLPLMFCGHCWKPFYSTHGEASIQERELLPGEFWQYIREFNLDLSYAHGYWRDTEGHALDVALRCMPLLTKFRFTGVADAPRKFIMATLASLPNVTTLELVGNIVGTPQIFPTPYPCAPTRLLFFNSPVWEHQGWEDAHDTARIAAIAAEGGFMENLLQQCSHNLEYLQLRGESIRFPLMKRLPWPCLKELVIRGRPPSHPQISLIDVLTHMPLLRVLDARYQGWKSKASLLIWPPFSIDVEGNTTLSHLDTLILTNPSSEDLIFANLPPGLRCLSLLTSPRRCTFQKSAVPFNCEQISQLLMSSAPPSLKILRVGIDGTLYTSFLEFVSSAFPHLEELEIQRFAPVNGVVRESPVSAAFRRVRTAPNVSIIVLDLGHIDDRHFSPLHDATSYRWAKVLARHIPWIESIAFPNLRGHHDHFWLTFEFLHENDQASMRWLDDAECQRNYPMHDVIVAYSQLPSYEDAYKIVPMCTYAIDEDYH